MWTKILILFSVLFTILGITTIAVPGANAAAKVCVVSADNDHSPTTCGPYHYPKSHGISGGIEVDNGVWSVPAGFTNRKCKAGKILCQTLYATNPGHWHVMANYPAGNTSVVSYPATYQEVDWVNGKEPKLSRWKTMHSSYAESFKAHTNKGTVAEAAYDIWLNNWNDEVMIQTNFAGDKLRPRCDVNGDVVAKQKFGGAHGIPQQRWNLCDFGDELIWQPATGINHASGKVAIMAMLKYLETHRHGKNTYLPRNSGLTAIGWGFEICSTGGKLENFPMTGFTLTATRLSAQ